MKLAIILAALALAGCSHVRIQAGSGVHASGIDAPEIGLNPWLGFVRIEGEDESGRTYFCEHVSAIDQYEDGYGLNTCGVLVNFQLK